MGQRGGLGLGQKHRDGTVLTQEGGREAKEAREIPERPTVTLSTVGLTPFHPTSIPDNLRLLSGWDKDRRSTTYSN